MVHLVAKESDVKEFAPSCDRNKDFILRVLKEVLPPTGTVLEIGSGTGQHAAYFTAQLPQHIWHPTDLSANFPSIRAWANDRRLPNLRRPMELDLLADIEKWPLKSMHAIVCINTIHIVAWKGVENLFAGAGRMLERGGVLYLYGAFRYASRPLEPSNQAFHELLQARDPASGVRDFEAVNELAQKNGLTLAGDLAMPGNNRSISWSRS